MSQAGEPSVGVGRRVLRATMRASVIAMMIAAGPAQLGILAGARASLGGRFLLSWSGLFAALASTQALIYWVLVVASLGAALRTLEARPPAAVAGQAPLVSTGVALRLWLVVWLVLAMAARALLAQGLGTEALLAAP